MSSVNRVILVGRTGQDPELRYLPNGEAVANISLATGEKWKDKATGEMKESTEWHRVTLYRKLAEIVGEYVKKGALLYIEGRLQTRKWTDKEGVERYTTEIVANEMKMLGPKRDDQDNAGNPPGGSRPRNYAPVPASTRPSADDLDDEIPF